MRGGSPTSEQNSLAALAGGGELGRRIRDFDWSSTPLGPIGGWPQSLRSALSICLNSNFPIAIYWSEDLVLLYNDEWSPIPGEKHPWALGRPAREAWPEIWHIIEPLFRQVLTTGEATRSRDQLLPMHRHGFTEECYFDYTFSPIRGESGEVEGVFNAVLETTTRVIGERRLRTLRELGAWRTGEARTAEEACKTAAHVIADNPHDLPFVLLYLLDGEGGGRATLVGLTGLARHNSATPASLEVNTPDSPWPFRQVVETGKSVELDDLSARFGPVQCGAWPEPPQRAVIMPMAKSGQMQLAGFLVVGVSPRLALNDDYRGFLDLLAGHVSAAVANARAYEEERRRTEALAELDRAKTAFFSNVSHEFRTPMTLMLGPVEDILGEVGDELSPLHRQRLEIVHRNGLRLQKLVNNLLDFSRIEAGKERASFEPTELAAFTADLASNFRSACEKAGLELLVDCLPLAESVFVDRGMWEKIVLNLLSNAFKFTFEGKIAISLQYSESAAELRVQDTGTGIPADEMPRLFERFHRVENAKGRTHEGSGIGLALVQELVKLHGGSITAESEVGRGTTFTISIPLGSNHLPREQIRNNRSAHLLTMGASPFVEEALRWSPEDEQRPDHSAKLPSTNGDFPFPASTSLRSGVDQPRVLVAEDNADMRQYIGRLLAGQYAVEAVTDGEAALAAVRRHAPDLILSDVMMPRLDGFGLLRELRADPATVGIPVVLLSARAGEESRVEGVQAGADDYLVKPFSARELLARVGALLQITRLRREAEREVRASEERFRLLFDTMTEGFAINEIIFDENGRGCDLRYLDLNPAFERHTGLKRSEIVGRTTLEMFPDAEPEWFERFGEVATSGVSAHFQAKFGPLDKWFEVSAYRTATRQIATVFFDITEQKRAGEAVRESETRWRTMAEALPNLVWTDLPDGRCDWLSSQWRKYTGIPEAELLGLQWLDRVLHPDDRARTLACWQAACADQGDYDLEYRIRRHDGEYRWFKTRGVPIRNQDGKIVYWFGTCTDIEDVKRMEAALREQDKRKDEFLATLAHELRNPLAPIRNGLQVMRLAKDNSKVIEQSRSMMDRQLDQMVRLVDDLMDVSRISRGKLELKKERLELATVVNSAIETSWPLIEQMGHELTVTFPKYPIVVDADLTRLAQVFLNLLNNAAKYSDQGGRIRLTVERQGSDVVVSIADSGIGIAPDQLSRIFEMFSQVDRSLEKSQGGLGIGLTLVKRLVEMHEGSIVAKSDGPGQGSEFIVRLPVIVEASVPPKPQEKTDNKLSLRILIVDDNRDSADSLGMMLKIMGNDTRTAYDGEEAVSVAKQFQPDVILLDIGLPKLNGYEACRRIREERGGRSMVIIAQTGWGQHEDRQRTHAAGFDHHMVKPVDPAALTKMLSGLADAASK